MCGMELSTKKLNSIFACNFAGGLIFYWNILQVIHFSIQTCIQCCRLSSFLSEHFASGPLFNLNLHSFVGGLIFYPNSPNNSVTGLIFTSKLTYDLASRLKCQLHNALVVIWGSQMEDRENVLPPRLNAGCLWVHHLCHAPHHHITDCRRSGKKNEDLKLKSSLPVPHTLHHLITDYRRHGKGKKMKVFFFFIIIFSWKKWKSKKKSSSAHHISWRMMGIADPDKTTRDRTTQLSVCFGSKPSSKVCEPVFPLCRPGSFVFSLVAAAFWIPTGKCGSGRKKQWNY